MAQQNKSISNCFYNTILDIKKTSALSMGNPAQLNKMDSEHDNSSLVCSIYNVHWAFNILVSTDKDASEVILENAIST